MSKPKVTPKGVFVFPCLTRPDTKFKPEGEYYVKLCLPAEAAAPIVEEIQAALDAKVEEVKASGKVKGKIKRVDPSIVEDEENGEVTIKFSMKASGKRKDGTTWTQKPTLKKYDLTDIDPNTHIWGGSEGRVAYELSPFHTALGVGVSVRLRGVQVIKLVSGGGGDCGFEAEEDGGGFDRDDGTDAFFPEDAGGEPGDADSDPEGPDAPDF